MKYLIIFLLVLNCASKEEFTFNPPIDKGRISSNIGGRWGRLHLGVDIACPRGTEVKATNSGIVISVIRRHKIFGNRVEVFHPQIGLYSSYSHLHEIKTDVGIFLEAGDIIGLVGSTGKSTGNHLHFEIYNANQVYLNPINLFKSHGYSFKYK